MSDLVLLERDGPIATLIINRPDKLNALNLDVLEALGGRVEELREDATIRCAILTGAGDKAFVAGADIGAMQELGVDQAREFAQRGHAALAGLETLRFPVIAAVHGFALGGGCEVALACDFIHASAKAKFGQPEVKLGVIPGFGGTQRLARRVGIGRARELVYTGRMVRAEEALAMGLVNAVHPVESFREDVMAVAKEIATMGPFAISVAKRVLREGEELVLSEANSLEIEGFARCFATTDQSEGMQAFLEKRAAAFTGE